MNWLQQCLLSNSSQFFFFKHNFSYGLSEGFNPCTFFLFCFCLFASVVIFNWNMLLIYSALFSVWLSNICFLLFVKQEILNGDTGDGALSFKWNLKLLYFCKGFFLCTCMHTSVRSRLSFKNINTEFSNVL